MECMGKGPSKTNTKWYILTAIVVVVLLLFYHRYGAFGRTGKATSGLSAAEHQACVHFWQPFCERNECTGQTVQCQHYCSDKTNARCVIGNIPVPNQ